MFQLFWTPVISPPIPVAPVYNSYFAYYANIENRVCDVQACPRLIDGRFYIIIFGMIVSHIVRYILEQGHYDIILITDRLVTTCQLVMV